MCNWVSVVDAEDSKIGCEVTEECVCEESGTACDDEAPH